MRKQLGFRVAGLALACGASANAFADGLEGSQVTFSGYCCSAAIPASLISNQPTATVGAGVEFPLGSLTANSGFVVVQQSVDIGSGTIDTNYLSAIQASPGSFNGPVYTFVGAPDITAVTVDPLSTFTPVGVSFTSNSISINAAGLLITNGQRLLLDVVTTPVPEPSTYLLLSAGLAGLVVARRKRSLMRTGSIRV